MSSEFRDIKKNNPNNLIYEYKTEGISSKNFSVYQNLIDLGKIKKRKSKIKIRRSDKCNEKWFFKRFFFLATENADS